LLQLNLKSDEVLLAGTDDYDKCQIFTDSYKIIKNIKLSHISYYFCHLIDNYMNKLIIPTFQRINFYNISEDNIYQTMQGHNNYIYKVSQLIDFDSNILVSCSNDAYLKVWDIENNKFLYDLKGHSASVIWIEYLRNLNSKFVVSNGTDKFLILWDVIGKNQLSRFDYNNIPNINMIVQPQKMKSNYFLFATRVLNLIKIDKSSFEMKIEKKISDRELVNYISCYELDGKIIIVCSNYGNTVTIYEDYIY